MSDIPIPIVQMQGVTKHFGHVLANDQVDFELLPGEIHGLLGENGAGKTTLMNILYGMHQPDRGVIRVRGVAHTVHSPHDAIRLGIGMVHQHFTQVPTLTVIDNIILGMQSAGQVLLDRRAARQRILQIAQAYGLHVEPDARIWQLSIGDRQRVEILKALYRNADILILDEPTSVLTPQESEDLFHTIRQFVQQGLSVIFITHNLEEAMAITDRVTVLRDGRVAATLPTAQTDKAQLANYMVGREVLFRLHRANDRPSSQAALKVENLSVKGDRGPLAVRDVSFEVHNGEIVGLAGVDGNGQSELVQALAGLRPLAGGAFYLDGEPAQHASTRHLLAQGLGYIPENLEDAILSDFTLVENLFLNRFYTAQFSRRGVLNQPRMLQEARQLIQRYDIRAPHEMVKARTLSGGNKQKLIVARELARNPKVLVAAHPTRGVDIGAEEYIRNLLLDKRHEGMAILLVSTKLDEILSLSDRILVIERGRIMGEMARAEADIEKIGLMMAGSEA